MTSKNLCNPSKKRAMYRSTNRAWGMPTWPNIWRWVLFKMEAKLEYTSRSGNTSCINSKTLSVRLLLPYLSPLWKTANVSMSNFQSQKVRKGCPAFLSKLAKMIRNITSLRCFWKMMNMSQIQSREWQLHIMWRPRRSLILPSNMHHFKFLGSVYYLAETVIKNQRLFSPLWE